MFLFNQIKQHFQQCCHFPFTTEQYIGSSTVNEKELKITAIIHQDNSYKICLFDDYLQKFKCQNLYKNYMTREIGTTPILVWIGSWISLNFRSTMATLTHGGVLKLFLDGGVRPEVWNPYPYLRIFLPPKTADLTVFSQIGPIFKGFFTLKTADFTIFSQF